MCPNLFAVQSVAWRILSGSVTSVVTASTVPWAAAFRGRRDQLLIAIPERQKRLRRESGGRRKIRCPARLQ